MHGSKAAKDTDESEYSGRRKTLLPRLASSKDWRQWAFKTETILKQEEIWYAIEGAAPAREVVALSANETARLRKQRQAQLAGPRLCRAATPGGFQRDPKLTDLQGGSAGLLSSNRTETV